VHNPAFQDDNINVHHIPYLSRIAPSPSLLRSLYGGHTIAATNKLISIVAFLSRRISLNLDRDAGKAHVFRATDTAVGVRKYRFDCSTIDSSSGLARSRLSDYRCIISFTSTTATDSDLAVFPMEAFSYHILSS